MCIDYHDSHNWPTRRTSCFGLLVVVAALRIDLQVAALLLFHICMYSILCCHAHKVCSGGKIKNTMILIKY